MRLRKNAEFLIVFTSFLSFLTMVPPPLHLSGYVVPHVSANPAPNEPWYPAGPAMDTLTFPAWANPVDESNDFANANPSLISEDLVDFPITNPNAFSGPSYLITQVVVPPGFYSVEFNLANNFWGCDFNFGNPKTQTAPLSNNCGVEIRQGISHLVDKKIFVDQALNGFGAPLDNPVTQNAAGPQSPNPCQWDASFLESGSGCTVGGGAATAYHLAAATAGTGCGLIPFPWMPGCTTPDFCAAAQHFINAGLATGKDSRCVLTGPSTTAINAHPVDFFIRNDNTPLRQIGESIDEEICALFIGQFTLQCTVNSSNTHLFSGIDEGTLSSFGGFVTSPGTINLSWGMFTAGAGSENLPDTIGKDGKAGDPFDTTLYFAYNSQFVSATSSLKPPQGPCSPTAGISATPGNYVYFCSSSYDVVSSQMEYATCLTKTGDPTIGQVTPTFANCSGGSVPWTCSTTSNCTAYSAGYQSEDQLGQGAFILPIYYPKLAFPYLNGWQRVINSIVGTPNFFTYLDAYDPSPHTAGTLRQGLAEQGHNLNPFIASVYPDTFTLQQVYDTPSAINPTVDGDIIDWMTIKTDTLTSSLLSYSPPTGTIAAYRLTLRNDMFFQYQGTKVTAFDFAFSYISMMYAGAGTSAATSVITGVKVLSPTQIDLDVSAFGPFTKVYLTGQSILPAEKWSGSGNWKTDVQTKCGVSFAGCGGLYTITSGVISCTQGCQVTGGDMTPSQEILPNHDPIADGIFIGSGPWSCGTADTPGIGGPGCSTSGTSIIPANGSLTLTRFGKATSPGGSLSGTYFRSSGNLALWIWSGDRGVFSVDFLNFGQVSLCFGKPVGTSGCTVWQHGIGGSATGTMVGLTQVGIVQRFVGVNWVSPYNWVSQPPQNIATFPPVLYEGAVTLNPCSVDPVNGYDC